MYKKLLPTLLLAGCSFFAQAQPTLTAANSSPLIWQSFLNVICDTTGVSEGPSGASVTWDFAATIRSTATRDSGEYVPCSATSRCSTFPGSNYAIISQATTVVPYYIASASKLQQNGIYRSADTFAIYSDPIDQIRYPFTYGTTYDDTYSGVLYAGGLSAIESGTITVTGDAYGTLVLPAIHPFTPGTTTFSNVLRVHTVQNYTDSLSFFGTPLLDSFRLETYAWYAPNYHAAIMTIAYTRDLGGLGFDNKVVDFAPIQIKVATQNIENDASTIQLFPNPAKDELNIKYSTVTSEQVRISLVDLLGREVSLIANKNTQGDQLITFNTNNISKGLYLIRFQSGEQTITRKIEIQ